MLYKKHFALQRYQRALANLHFQKPITNALNRFRRINAQADLIACNLLSQLCQSPTEKPVSRLAVLERIMGKFGMNPSDRTRISVPAVIESDPVDEFFR